jgi:hypothetical protein
MWLLHFQDSRPPQEIQFELEERLMTLMPPRMQAGKLVCSGKTKMTGAPYSLLLTFEAALPKKNCYSLPDVRGGAAEKELLFTVRGRFLGRLGGEVSRVSSEDVRRLVRFLDTGVHAIQSAGP